MKWVQSTARVVGLKICYKYNLLCTLTTNVNIDAGNYEIAIQSASIRRTEGSGLLLSWNMYCMYMFHDIIYWSGSCSVLITEANMKLQSCDQSMHASWLLSSSMSSICSCETATAKIQNYVHMRGSFDILGLHIHLHRAVFKTSRYFQCFDQLPPWIN